MQTPEPRRGLGPLWHSVTMRQTNEQADPHSLFTFSSLPSADKLEHQIILFVNTTRSAEAVLAWQQHCLSVCENTSVKRVEGTPDLVGVIEI